MYLFSVLDVVNEYYLCIPSGKCREYESRMQYQDASILKLKDELNDSSRYVGQSKSMRRNNVDDDPFVNPFGLMLEELLAPSHREGLSSENEAKAITHMLKAIEEGLQEVFR